MVVLPFGDMILFTSTCSVAILFSAVLSILLLKEKFIWKYDLTAAILICTGCTLTVFQMHMDDVKYDTKMVKDMVFSTQSIFLQAFTLLLGIITVASYLKLKQVVETCS